MQGRSRLADHTINAEAHEPHEIELGRARRAWRAIVRDADLAMAKPRDQAAQVGILVLDRAQVLDDGSIDQAKIPGILGKVHFAYASDEPVVELANGLHQPRLFAPTAHPVDDFIALLPEVNELGNHFRGILEVRIDLHGSVAPRQKEVGQNGPLIAEIPREADDPDARIHLRLLRQTLIGRILTGVVGEHELKVIVRL